MLKDKPKGKGKSTPRIARWIDPNFIDATTLTAAQVDIELTAAGGKSKSYTVETRSPGGRPETVITPIGKTKYHRRNDFGLIIEFTPMPEKAHSKRKPVTSVAKSAAESVNKHLKPVPENNEKVAVEHITEKGYLEVAAARVASGNKRYKTQNRSIAKGDDKEASMPKIAKALDLDSEQAWEWLHMIAFLIKGNAAQTADNLVGGTKKANTSMKNVEACVKKISKLYPEGFYLKVRSELIPGTHIAKKIHYTIVTKDFELPFVFDAQQNQSTLTPTRRYIRKLIDLILEHTKTKLDIDIENTPPPIKCPKLFQPHKDEVAQNLFPKLENTPPPLARKPKMPRMFKDKELDDVARDLRPEFDAIANTKFAAGSA